VTRSGTDRALTDARVGPHPGGALLVVRDLAKHFPIRQGVLGRTVGHVRAVDGVSFEVRRGATLALVGESGCGKTTLGRLILRLMAPTRGQVVFDGVDTLSLDRAGLKRFRRRAQLIFQDPFGSLNPRMTVETMLGEVIKVHGLSANGRLDDRIAELLDAVGLHADDARKYPHEFSGGQRQRIGIARALAVQPEFVVADEPVSALDVSVQAQVLNLLGDLQDRFNLTYLLITHDLSVVRQIADRLAVMYLGRIVEIGDSKAIFGDPLHPYTEALLSAVPVSGAAGPRRRISLSGEVASPSDPSTGCPFHPRCPHPGKDATCRSELPPLGQRAERRLVACHKV
jgi:oligopeptide transport system ATP-binding protein